MNRSTYRDMHLLDELSQRPDSTQRELSKRIGTALGLTNLMLRRLITKGYVKISGTKRSRLRYLITPQGIMEKTRLTYEFIQYSLQLYSRVRRALCDQLEALAQGGRRRIVLCDTGELAEIAYLTIQERRLTLVGVVTTASSSGGHFLGYPVRRIEDVPLEDYDWVVVTSPRWDDGTPQFLIASGVPPERIISLHQSGVPLSSSPAETRAIPPLAIPTPTTEVLPEPTLIAE